MRNFHKPFLLFLPAMLLLTSCATRERVPDKAEAKDWELQKAALNELQNWRVRGRISVQIDHEAWSATMRWEQNDDEYRINLTGPLGQGAVELIGGPDQVVLHTADNRLLYDASPESLMEKTFGWYVPIVGLKHWIKGAPSPDSKPRALSLDEHGNLSTLAQSGWTMEYSRYLEYGRYRLPQRLNLENKQRKLRLRLAILEWPPVP